MDKPGGPVSQQEGLAIVVSAPLYGGGPKTPLQIRVLWVWQEHELLAQALRRGVQVTSAGDDYPQLRPTQATSSSQSEVESIIQAVFKPPRKGVQVILLSDITDDVPVASIVQVLPKPSRRSLIPDVVQSDFARFVYSHECRFQP